MGYRGRSKGNYGNQQRRGSACSSRKGKRLVQLHEGWRENPKEFRKEVQQGSIPDSVWNNADLQEYLSSGGVFGYVGHFDRTAASDAILLEEAKKVGVRSDRLAGFMMSADSRHIADYLPNKEMFREQLAKHFNYGH